MRETGRLGVNRCGVLSLGAAGAIAFAAGCAGAGFGSAPGGPFAGAAGRYSSAAGSRVSDPLPAPLGARGLGTTGHRLAALSLSDSVVRSWGWRVIWADSAMAQLRTDWLYLPSGAFVRESGSQCEDGGVVGLRLTVGPGATGRDTLDFVVRGEAQVLNGARRADAERVARNALATIGAELRTAVQAAAARPDVFVAGAASPWGEIAGSTGGPARFCGGVRP